MSARPSLLAPSVLPHRGEPASARAPGWARLLTVAVFALAALLYLVVSWRWRIMVDSSVMHYVVFLLRHGRAPYTAISDNNMPGAYFVEALGMQLFGPGDLAWRLFEFSLLALLTAALLDIARRWDPIAGVFAAGLFVVLHSAEGPQYAAERELTLTTLLLLGYAVLFRAVDSRKLPLFALFGALAGLAASIKPTCLPLSCTVLLLAAFALPRREGSVARALGYALAGMALVFTLDLAFLLHFHALTAFGFILRRVLPAYVAMGRAIPLHTLLLVSLPRVLLPLVVLWPLLALANLRRPASAWSWQRWTLVLGAAFGLLSFLVQHKGYLHHRYPLEVFIFLLLGIEIFLALRRPGLPRALAALALGYTLLFVVPHTLGGTLRTVNQTDLEAALEGDLRHLGGAPALNDRVQCFDLVYGCLDALYHLDILENASFTGDLLFFPHQETEATRYYRQRFWTGVAHQPPELIVLTNQNLEDLNDFDKVQRWPQFARWLGENYTPVLERRFLHEHFGGRFPGPIAPPEQDAYRLYLRRGSPLLPQASTLPSERYPGQS